MHLRIRRTKLNPPVCPVRPSGPSDRCSRNIQRHPERLSRLQAARGPGLAAAPAAVAVVLRPLLLAGRLVASPLPQPASDNGLDETFV